MSQVTLTRFIDFVSKGGGPKMTVVRQWKYKEDYNPATDFYKPLRDSLVSMHANELTVAHLTALMQGLTDVKKRSNYPEVIEGYKKWRGRKKLGWFDPPSTTWRFQSLNVVVNPEFGLTINGIPHLIKIYLKGEPLSKTKINLITNLLAVACGPIAPKDCIMGVLDVRRGKLFTPPSPDPLLTTQLEGEAAYWCQVWDKV